MKVFSVAFSLLALVSPVVCLDASIQADSKLGQKLMSKARKLENNNDNYNY